MIRPVLPNDYYKGHLDLYKQLTSSQSNVDYDSYKNFLHKLNNNHAIFVYEMDNKIVGTITFLIEQKLFRNIKNVMHVEDVVVDTNYRKCGIGKLLLEKATNYARESNCYKIILNCSEENSLFYEKCGFEKREVEMAIYL